MVNQKQFKRKAMTKKLQRLRKLLLLAVASGNKCIQLRLYRKIRYVKTELGLIMTRTMLVVTSTFNLNAFSDEVCLREFRFRKQEVPIINNIVNWTTGVTKRNRYVCEQVTATCILLRRLAYPSRWTDLEPMFGMHSSALSEVFYECAWSMHDGYASAVTTFQTDLMKERAHLYAQSITASGGLLDNCVGFIDGTNIKMSRPGGAGTLQRSTYSGHKRIHCLSYQTVSTPDGLIFHLYGPVEGRQPDKYIYRKSNLDAALQDALCIDNVQYYLYGDQAYILRPWMQTAFPRSSASAEQVAYNTSMNAARIAVEWNYKDVKQMWTSNDFARKLQVRKGPFALLYIVPYYCGTSKLVWGTSLKQNRHFVVNLPPSIRIYTYDN
eukprot:IDg1560t1